MIPLMPHQTAAIEWLEKHHWRGLWWITPGAGKTYSALAAWHSMGRPRALILCTASTKKQWFEESKKFFNENVATVIEGTSDERKVLWSNDGLLIANYDILVRDWPSPMLKPYGLVVADECQKISSPVAKRTKTFKKLVTNGRIAMSGSPAMNGRLEEYWSCVDWIRPGILEKTFYDFRRRHCKTHPVFPSQITGYYDENFLRKTIASVTYRIKREEIQDELQLPSLTIETQELAFTDGTLKEAYVSMRDQFLFELEKKHITAVNAVAKIIKLRQLVDYPQIFNKEWISPKELWFAKHLEQRPEISRLVFFEFTLPCEELARKYKALCIVGATSQAERSVMVDAFMKGENKLLFVTSACEEGLNLQKADEVIHMGLPWNSSKWEQRNARTWRKGRQDKVTAVVPLLSGSVDNMLWRTIQHKQKSIDKMDVEELLASFKATKL